MTALVLQLSDTHLTGDPSGLVHGIDPVARLEMVLDAWRRRGQEADLVLLTGDDTEDGSLVASELLHAMVSTLGAPVLALPGNHDDPTTLGQVFGPAEPVELAGWRVVPLASSRPGQMHGTLDVADALQRLDEHRDLPTLVAVHHPPVPPSTHPWFQLDGAAALLEGLAERPHVRALVSGHLHEPFELLTPDGTLLLGCPSTYVPIAHHGDRYELGGDRPSGARLIWLDPDGTLRTELLVA